MAGYRETYQSELQTLRAYIQRSLEPTAGRYAWSYFNKSLKLAEIYEQLRNHNFMEHVEVAVGNVNAPIAVVVEGFTDERSQVFLQALRRFCDAVSTPQQKVNYHDFCVLSYNKNTLFFDQSKVLTQELVVVNPKFVLTTLNMTTGAVPCASTFHRVTAEDWLDEAKLDTALHVIFTEALQYYTF